MGCLFDGSNAKRFAQRQDPEAFGRDGHRQGVNRSQFYQLPALLALEVAVLPPAAMSVLAKMRYLSENRPLFMLRVRILQVFR
jgi:hypothetical protein